jgi:L-lactate utilization protein LutB
MMPTFDARRYSELSFSSTLNGSYTNVCPVKINMTLTVTYWTRNDHAGEEATR